MSTATETVQAKTISVARARVYGWFFVGLAFAIVWWFVLGTDGDLTSTFRLNGRDQFFDVPDLDLPTRLSALFLAAVCAGLGAIQLTRGFGRRIYVVLGVVVACFVLAFLIWAARDGSLNFLGMLQSTLLAAVPITLGALAGVLCERSGIINIAIEGMMLMAAFVGALVGSAAGSLTVGLLLGVGSGALMAALLAVLSIRYRVEQIIAGTVLNIFALGMT
ncbi:MAG TPA: ABC transporter permease, partial [Actinomycetota bacterium]|nr:ABC transporter permease [Actinomycetota bacterium]